MYTSQRAVTVGDDATLRITALKLSGMNSTLEEKMFLLADLYEVTWHTMWEYWKSLFSIVNDHAPIKVVRKKNCSLPWISKETHQLTRAQNYHRQKSKKTRNADDWMKFEVLKKRVVREMHLDKIKHFNNICNETRNQSRQAWSELSSFLGQKARQIVSFLSTEHGRITTKTGIVNAFSKHFGSIPTSLLPAKLYHLAKAPSKFQFITTSVKEVHNYVASFT